jgi:ribonucleoside-diphosphate reductase beta chain
MHEVEYLISRYYGLKQILIFHDNDRRLISLGLKGIFKVKKNPLPWVEEMINAPVHGNFFENRVTDYAKGTLKGTWEDVWGGAE